VKFGVPVANGSWYAIDGGAAASDRGAAAVAAVGDGGAAAGGAVGEPERLNFEEAKLFACDAIELTEPFIAAARGEGSGACPGAARCCGEGGGGGS